MIIDHIGTAIESKTTLHPDNIMIRHDNDRIDAKRKNTISHKKKQFAEATYKQQEYPHRLNLYQVPPIAEITLEEFEQWAIDRLRSMETLRVK